MPQFLLKHDFRKWLEQNYDTTDELWIGYYKKATGKPSMTWPESVDVALCFGWIDGIRKSIDEESYKIRFTPRRKGSHWSNVNINRVKELTKAGLMHPSGIEVFKKKKKENSGNAAFEQKSVTLPIEYMNELKKHEIAHSYYQNLPPSIRKQYNWWVMSAKRKTTQQNRLAVMIDSSEKGERIPPLKWTNKKH